MTEILPIIINEYSLPEDTKIISKIKEGVLSHNWIIGNSQSQYFLKKYKRYEETRIQEIHQTANYLSEHGIPVVLPLKCQNNLDYWQDNKGDFFALFPCINSNKFLRGKVSEKTIISAAKMLAKIHRLSLSDKIDINQTVSDWNDEKFFTRSEDLIKIIREKKELTDFDKSVLEKIKLQTQIIKKSDLKFSNLSLKKDTLCHGDYQDGNIFLSADGQVQWIFDLEKCEMAPRIYEVLRAIDLMFLDVDFSLKNLSDVKIFIQAYHKDYPLASQEIIDGCLARFIKQAHGLWIEQEYYLRGDSRPVIYLNGRLNYLQSNPEDFSKFLIKCIDTIDITL